MNNPIYVGLAVVVIVGVGLLIAFALPDDINKSWLASDVGRAVVTEQQLVEARSNFLVRAEAKARQRSGMEALATEAFAACVRGGAGTGRGTLDRCEVQATTLARMRGYGEHDANMVVQQVRADMAAELAKFDE
ncbi:hypothetical protein R088_24545 [Salmonella enterica subsp. enterica serovar Heidelberg]|nr:hypothetical protein [Salmonella enterica subsp. enterica serovar Heidelberg]EEK2418839.1 hypothetical protein [Salmonella enterica subsp. enterica serovar Heidelberg]